MKPELVGLNELVTDRELTNLLENYPHVVRNLAGTIVLKGSVQQLTDPINVDIPWSDGGVVGTLQCRATDREILLKTLQLHLQFKAQSQNYEGQRLDYKVIGQDLMALMKLSENVKSDIEKDILQALLLVRAHLPFMLARVYLISPKGALTPRFELGLGGQAKEAGEWEKYEELMALQTAMEKVPYIAHSVQKDPFFASYFQPKSDQNPQEGEEIELEPLIKLPKNFATFPLIFNGVVLGVVNISNALVGKWTPEKKMVMNNYCKVIGQVIKERQDTASALEVEKSQKELKKYLATNLADKIQSQGMENIGGVEKRIVVMFVLIQNFDSICKKFNPPTLVTMLNYHYQTMNSIAEKWEGTLDKILGPTLMVIWNHPYTQEDPETKAIQAGLEMIELGIKKIRGVFASKGAPEYTLGIGVNSGKAVAGNLGSQDFMDYTVIGDTINTAQRLEMKAKAWEMMVHENMIAKVAGKVPRPLKKRSGIKLKGKSKDTTAFVFGMPPQNKEQKPEQ